MAKKKQKDPYGEIKRNKDLSTIRDLFLVFPRLVVDNVLEQALCDRIYTDHIDCLISAETFFRSTVFHLYDKKLRQLLNDLFRHWNLAWDIGRMSHHDHHGRGLATLILSETAPPERWAEHDAYLDHLMKAQRSMIGVTKHLHEKFPEFDLTASDNEASRKYSEMLQHVEQHMKELLGESEPDQVEGQPIAKDGKGVTDQSPPGMSANMKSDASREFLIKVGNLKGLLNERARGGNPSEPEYSQLRSELIAIVEIRNALPNFVLTCRTLQEFWLFIKPKYAKWNERTEFLKREFEPIMSWLEGSPTAVVATESRWNERTAEKVRVLLLSANPLDAPLNIEEEFRAIDARIRASDHRDHVQLIFHGAVRLEDIPGLLMRHKPHVVHFSGHGAAGAIELTQADGSSHLVPPKVLADIFRVLKDNVRIVLLNACDSAPQAQAIVEVIDCGVGMSDEIEDSAAVAFAAAFYETLGYGRSIQDAFDLAIIQLAATGADRSLAKLYKRKKVNPSSIILVNPTA